MMIYKWVYGYDLKIEILIMREHFTIQDLANTANLAVPLNSFKSWLVDWNIYIFYYHKSKHKQTN